MKIIVTEFEIGFENLEVANIPPEYVLDVRISGMTEFRIMMNDEEKLGVWLRAKDAERVFMVMNKAVKGKVITNCDKELWERLLRYPDITVIKVKYSDGTEENIYVAWEDGNAGGEINALQKHYFDNEGNLVIKIGKFGDK